MQFTRWFRIVILAATAVAHVAVCRADTVSDQDAARLQLVKNYADTVLNDAADRYHPQDRSPVLAGGINVYTKDQLKWIFPESVDFPNGRAAVWSDFAVQQNLMRVLVALTNLTGDSKYKDSAKAQYAYYFAHQQDKSGLLQWGGHRFVDLQTLSVEGTGAGDAGQPA